MKLLVASLLVVLGSLPAFGQQATLVAARTPLAAQGGFVKLTATATYEEAPSALGWSIVLPAGWTLQRTAGTMLPEIAPAAGAAGKLDWAFIAVPASPAQFEIVLRYPAGSTQSEPIDAELVLCVDGKTGTVPANRLVLRRVPAASELPER